MITEGLLLTATTGLLLAGPVPATGDERAPEPGPITITLTPERSQQICDVRIPRLLERIDGVTARINGDADTPGSIAFVEARVADLRAEGKDDAATLLQQRADRRAGRVQLLAELRERVVAFDTRHCR